MVVISCSISQLNLSTDSMVMDIMYVPCIYWLKYIVGGGGRLKAIIGQVSRARMRESSRYVLGEIHILQV